MSVMAGEAHRLAEESWERGMARELVGKRVYGGGEKENPREVGENACGVERGQLSLLPGSLLG